MTIDPGAAEQIQSELRAVRQRWIDGARLFQQAVDRAQKSRAQEGGSIGAKTRLIRSAVHGDIRLRVEEAFLLDSFYVQRLRGVSQMGLLNLVYPEARHSRFEHCLGVLHVTHLLLTNPRFANELLSDQDRLDLGFAALIHDIGHGPFSHSTETMLDVIGIDEVIREETEFEKKFHEVRGASIIRDQDYVQLVHLGLGGYGIRNYLDLANGLGCADRVAGLVTGEESALTPVISDTVDVDKLDYFQRDSYYTGAASGSIDADRLISLVGLAKTSSGRRVVIHEKGLASVFQILYGRPSVYASTVFHPVVRIAEGMLVAAFDLALRILPISVQADILLALELMDDGDLMRLLETVAWGTSTREGRVLRSIVDGIRSRRLYKRIAQYSLSEFLPALGFASEDDVYEFFSPGGETKYVDVFALGRDVADQLRKISSEAPEGIVGVVVPKRPEPADRIKTRLERIHVSSGPDAPVGLITYLFRRNKTPTAALTEVVEHAQAISRIEHDLWRAFVIVSPEVKEWLVLGVDQPNLVELLVPRLRDTFRKSGRGPWRPKAHDYLETAAAVAARVKERRSEWEGKH